MNQKIRKSTLGKNMNIAIRKDGEQIIKSIMAKLLDRYNNFTPKQEYQKEIDDSHKAVIRSLEKPE